MILKDDSPWGTLRGKISCTPEQALTQWGFVMREGAHGVLFRGYTYLDDMGVKHKGTFISNFNPPSNPQTPEQQTNRTKMKEAVLHWQLLDPPAHKEWNKKASKLKMSGFNLHNQEFLRGHI